MIDADPNVIGIDFVVCSAASASDIAPVQAAVNLGTVVAIVVIIFVLLLIVVDVSCYFINHCGVTMCICVHLCGRSSAFTKEKAMEEGERLVLPAAIACLFHFTVNSSYSVGFTYKTFL